MASTQEQKRRKIGMVVSDKSMQTIIVRLDDRFKHPLYKKYVTRSTRVHVHDPESKASVGDQVAITEGRPVSKHKCWYLDEIVRTKS